MEAGFHWVDVGMVRPVLPRAGAAAGSRKASWGWGVAILYAASGTGTVVPVLTVALETPVICTPPPSGQPQGQKAGRWGLP